MNPEPAANRPAPRMLLLGLEGADWSSPAPWGQLTALPFLGRLDREGARMAWPSSAAPEPSALWQALLPGLLAALSQAGLGVGLFNLPGAGSASPAVFVVPRLEAALRPAPAVHPPELAQDLGDYLTGAAWAAQRPAPHSHEADNAFAEQAALARLVFEHARRLLGSYQVDLAAVGFAGLAQIRAWSGPDSGRELLFLRQLDAYAAGLAQALDAQVVCCLSEQAGLLAWGPERLRPGLSPQGTPQDLAPALLGMLGLPGLNLARPTPGDSGRTV